MADVEETTVPDVETSEEVSQVEETKIDLSKPPKRLPKPDRAKLDKQIQEVDDEIKQLEEQRLKLRSQFDAKKNSRNEAQEQLKAARAEFNRLRAEFNRAKEERAEIFNQQNALKDVLNKKTAGAKGLRSEVKFTSLADIDEEIRRLEHKQNTETMSINQEKALLKQIEQLKQSKKSVRALAAQEDEIKAERDRRRDFSSRLDEKKAEMDDIKIQLDNQKKVLEALSESQAGPREDASKINEARDKLKLEIDAKYAEKKELWAQFKKDNDEYYNAQRAVRAYNNELKRVEAEKRKAQWEARQKAIEEEEAKKIPYEEEMQLCDVLVAYLQKTFLNTAQKQAAAAPSSGASVKTELEGGWTLLKREEEDYMSFGGGKKKGKKKGGKKEEKSTSTIHHSLDTLESFNLLGLTPPPTTSSVQASIDELKAKKAHFKTLPRPEKKKAEAPPSPSKAAAASPKSPKKGKKTQKFEAGDGDFPVLAGHRGTAVPAIGVYARAAPQQYSVEDDAHLEEADE